MTPMSQAALNVSAYQVLPPYRDAEPLDMSLPPSIGRGAMVAVRPHHSSTWPDLSECILAARDNFPAAAVIVWADCIGSERAANWGRLIRDYGARALITSVLDPLVLRRQESTARSVAHIAVKCGYYDAAALRKRCGELFGATPREIRSLIGWEPLLYHGCRRAGLLAAGLSGLGYDNVRNRSIPNLFDPP